MHWGRLVFGSVIVAAGAILLLDVYDVVDSGTVFATWWPLVLVVIGVTGYVSNPRSWIVPLIITLVGALLLLESTGVISTTEIVGPIVIIGIGAVVLFGAGLRRGGSRGVPGDRVDSFNAFSGAELASHSKHFEGGNIGTLFGGAELDLRDATPAPNAALDVFAAFGGVELRVPDGWDVETHGLPLFGGFENVTAQERLPDGAPHLEVNATVLFGGLTVKH